MGLAISVPQLIVIAVLIAVPIVCIRVVRAGPKGDLAQPFRFLNWGFWGYIAGIVGLVIAASLFPLDGEAVPVARLSWSQCYMSPRGCIGLPWERWPVAQGGVGYCGSDWHSSVH